MPLENYFEPFYLQRRFDAPDGLDDEAVLGVYAQSSSGRMEFAEARETSSAGQFVTSRDTPVSEGDILRRARDSLYIQIIGKPVLSPQPALSKFRKMNAEKMVMPV